MRRSVRAYTSQKLDDATTRSLLDLGTCCIGSAMPSLNGPEAKAELGIPADVEAVAPIIVGVPSGQATEVPRK